MIRPFPTSARALAGVASALIVWGCGSPRARTPSASSPDGILAAAIARDGCACRDESCLGTARGSLDRLKAKYASSDELPYDVYTADARFERCYLDGTKDIVRDLKLVTERFCSCKADDCQKAVDAIESFKEKYRDATARPEDVAPLAASKDALAACMRERVGRGSEFATRVESISEAMCACKSPDCAKGTLDRYMAELDRYPIIEHEGDSMERIHRAEEKMCACGGVAAISQPIADVLGVPVTGQGKCTITRNPARRTTRPTVP